ncbi:MAG: pilus assembly protein TadG-related protein, partial [Planctomycetota bacterium]
MRPANPINRRRGQIIVLAPVVIVVLLAMLALTADVGNMIATRARLQNAADAAALAATQVLWNEHWIVGSDEEDARAAALSEGLLIQQANAADAGCTIEFGTVDDDGNFTVADI